MATTSGWALWTPEMRIPVAGTVRFNGDIGQFAGECEAWLSEIVLPGSCLYVEAPIVTRTRLATTLRLIGVVVLAEKVAFAAGVEVIRVSPGTWRKHFIGVGMAPKGIPRAKRRRWLKEKALARCAELGWAAKSADGKVSDDAADALGLLSFACHQRGIRLAGSEGGHPMRWAA